MVSQAVVRGAVTGISFVLWFGYTLGGLAKISPLMGPAHEQMVADSAAWPAALGLDAVGIDDVTLRVAIGFAEVFLAVFLLTPRATPAAVALIGIMAGALYTHWRMDGVVGPNMAPAACMLVLLVALVLLRALLRAEAPVEKKDE